MPTLMSTLTAFGLAGGAGAKAFIPVLALGVFHHTSYFELSERWRWIADPVVMAVLGALVVVELVVDAVPELGELSDEVAYLPKIVAGFIAFAAATGTVDQSVLELGASGLLGGATAAGVHAVRNAVRRPFREVAEAVHEGSAKLATAGEAGASAAVSASAFLMPVLSVVALAGAGAIAFVGVRTLDRRRVPCVHCGRPIRSGALVCLHCKRDQRAPMDAGEGPPGPG